MKTFYSISMLAIAAMAAFSCAKEVEIVKEVEKQEVKAPLVITAYSDDDIAPDTKTTLSGVSVVWSEEDAVAGYKSDDINPHASTETSVADAGKKATFTFSDLTVGTNVTYLIYPASAAGKEGTAGDAGKYNVTLPTVQNATAGSFANGANIAIADGGVDAEAVQFKNIGGVLAFIINNDDIASVEISANEAMTGHALVTPGYPVDPTVVKDGNTYVTVSGTIANGSTYYAVVYPGTYTGLTIRVTNTSGQVATYSNPNPLVVNRNSNQLVAELTIPALKWKDQVYEKYSGVLSEGTYLFTQSTNALKAEVAGTTRLGKVTVAEYETGKIKNPNALIIWEIKQVDGYWVLYNKSTEKYAASTGSASAAQLYSSADDYSKYSVSSSAGSNDYEFVNKKNTANSVNAYFRYGGTYFACYASSASYKTVLYKLNDGKEDSGISYARTSDEITYGAALTPPALNNEHGLSLTCTTTNSSVADVNATTGAISITGNAGTATIKVSWAEQEISGTTYRAGNTSYTVTINKATPTLNAFASSTASVDVGAHKTITTTISGGLSITYTSSNTSIATVNSSTGEITGVADGIAIIYASFDGNSNYNAVTPVSYTLTVGAGAPGYAISFSGPAETGCSFTVTAGGSTVTSGDTFAESTSVTLSATAGTGYAFYDWQVYKTSDASVKVTVTNNAFTMPAYDVTIVAVFVHKEEISGTFTSSGTGASTKLTLNTASGLTIVQEKVSGSTSVSTSYNTATTLRVYVGHKLTFSGKTITKIEFTHTSDYKGSDGISSSPDTYSQGSTSSTWVGEATSIAITNSGGSTTRQLRPTKIVVYYK